MIAYASVISSPAVGTIPYATTVLSSVMAISDVPAPISTRATLRRRIVAGIRALIAAIGSSVKPLIVKSARFNDAISDSTTTRGKNVAITSTFISSPC